MNNDEYQALLKETELRLDKLKSLYEQWFQGLERQEPRRAREEAERRIALFRKRPTRNTALRFRTQTLIQRFVTLTTHWNRVGREIEEGRYVRDVERARRRARALDRAPVEREAKAYELDLDQELAALDSEALFDEPDLDAALAALEAPARVAPPPPPPAQVKAPPPPAAAKAAPPPPPGKAPPPVPRATPPAAAKAPAPPPAPKAGPAKAPPLPPAAAKAAPPPLPAPPATSASARFAKPKAAMSPPEVKAPVKPARADGGGPTEERIRDLYDRYVDARKRNNERVDNLRLEVLAASIRKMVPELEQKHRGKRIDFEVVVKNGRVGLKPVPKD
jgi:hypothetical protein